mmetsp:Transcript_11798/g.15407  ORF Transcript_11798/g.15407 Transcript_11798/m.15407 type:complete len:103 (+) Transcript_11798:892-1200(+)
MENWTQWHCTVQDLLFVVILNGSVRFGFGRGTMMGSLVKELFHQFEKCFLCFSSLCVALLAVFYIINVLFVLLSLDYPTKSWKICFLCFISMPSPTSILIMH